MLLWGLADYLQVERMLGCGMRSEMRITALLLLPVCLEFRRLIFDAWGSSPRVSQFVIGLPHLILTCQHLDVYAALSTRKCPGV